MKSAHESFAAMYRLHAPGVHRRAYELLGNEAEAREVVQDLFLSLLERPAQFLGRSAITSFLYSATTHACLNRLRNHRNRARLLSLHGPSHSPQEDGSRAERMVLLRDMLVRLPEPLAHVAVYYYMDEMTYDEIAEAMQCSRRHVANLLQRLATWHRKEES